MTALGLALIGEGDGFYFSQLVARTLRTVINKRVDVLGYFTLETITAFDGKAEMLQ